MGGPRGRSALLVSTARGSSGVLSDFSFSFPFSFPSSFSSLSPLPLLFSLPSRRSGSVADGSRAGSAGVPDPASFSVFPPGPLPSFRLSWSTSVPVVLAGPQLIVVEGVLVRPESTAVSPSGDEGGVRSPPGLSFLSVGCFFCPPLGVDGPGWLASPSAGVFPVPGWGAGCAACPAPSPIGRSAARRMAPDSTELSNLSRLGPRLVNLGGPVARPKAPCKPAAGPVAAAGRFSAGVLVWLGACARALSDPCLRSDRSRKLLNTGEERSALAFSKECPR